MAAVTAGFDVVGFDLAVERTKNLADGTSFTADVPDAELQAALATGRYTATDQPDGCADFDVAIITVPTPLREGDPDLTYIAAAARTLSGYLKAGATVVLESTTYPGTTEELMVPLLEAGSGLTAGRDFSVGYSPERIDPGNDVWKFGNTPKVVSGIDEPSLAKVAEFYGSIVETVVPVAATKVAELSKLLENTFRHVNIALVNELAIFAAELDIDIWAAIDAASTKPFGYMKFTPGPGIGGHCIPLDPHYLAWKMRTLNYKTRFIDLASEINSGMPDYVVEKVSRALNDTRKAVHGSRVLILGVAYKRDIDDMRESPALDIMRLLEQRGATVVFHDPHVAMFREDGHEYHSIALTPEALASADAVVIVTDHKAYDWQMVVDNAALVVDTRNATGKTTASRARIVSLADSVQPLGAGAH